MISRSFSDAWVNARCTISQSGISSARMLKCLRHRVFHRYGNGVCIGYRRAVTMGWYILRLIYRLVGRYRPYSGVQNHRVWRVLEIPNFLSAFFCFSTAITCGAYQWPNIICSRVQINKDFYPDDDSVTPRSTNRNKIVKPELTVATRLLHLSSCELVTMD